ncbi:33649_t:CDS:10 [Gigaspora margarita]|uniref:33649_t:CDS:1 n=1 Tax=Gigaspora margarita TaxID=4874 RepID=A0ABM8VXL2_GIGMA|nr:33649_t:CDS:10 [Gigaspora margarita]
MVNTEQVFTPLELPQLSPLQSMMNMNQEYLQNNISQQENIHQSLHDNVQQKQKEEEYLKEIEKRKTTYQEKYYPTNSRRFVYFFQGNPDNTISFSSKYWQHLVETRYKDLFTPVATIPSPKEIEETKKLQDEVKKLNAKVNELKSKVDKDGKSITSLTDLRTELDELKREIQLAGIKKESFEDLKKQSQDLLNRINQAEAENYIIHANPVKPISEVINKALAEKQKELDNLRNTKIREAKRENKRLELINGYLRRKLTGEVLSEAEECDEEINQKGLCRSCIREVIYKPKDEYCRNCNEKIDFLNTPFFLGNGICDNCFTIEEQKEINKKSLTLRENSNQEPLFELTLEYYKSTNDYYQFYDGIFIHQNHDIWQTTNRPNKWRDKYKLIVLEKNKKTNNYYECRDKIELLTFIDSYESYSPTVSSVEIVEVRTDIANIYTHFIKAKNNLDISDFVNDTIFDVKYTLFPIRVSGSISKPGGDIDIKQQYQELVQLLNYYPSSNIKLNNLVKSLGGIKNSIQYQAYYTSSGSGVSGEVQQVKPLIQALTNAGTANAITILKGQKQNNEDSASDDDIGGDDWSRLGINEEQKKEFAHWLKNKFEREGHSIIELDDFIGLVGGDLDKYREEYQDSGDTFTPPPFTPPPASDDRKLYDGLATKTKQIPKTKEERIKKEWDDLCQGIPANVKEIEEFEDALDEKGNLYKKKKPGTGRLTFLASFIEPFFEKEGMGSIKKHLIELFQQIELDLAIKQPAFWEKIKKYVKEPPKTIPPAPDLPQDIRTWLDRVRGYIDFSFGSFPEPLNKLAYYGEVEAIIADLEYGENTNQSSTIAHDKLFQRTNEIDNVETPLKSSQADALKAQDTKSITRQLDPRIDAKLLDIIEKIVDKFVIYSNIYNRLKHHFYDLGEPLPRYIEVEVE